MEKQLNSLAPKDIKTLAKEYLNQIKNMGGASSDERLEAVVVDLLRDLNKDGVIWLTQSFA